MRKILVTLICLLLFNFCALASSNVEGVWYGDLFGVEYTLTLNENGSYTRENCFSAFLEDTESGKWTLDDNTITLDNGSGDPVILTVTEKELINPFSGYKYTRERIPQYSAAPARTDITAIDFEGKWVSQIVNAYDMILSSDLSEIRLEIEIREGIVNVKATFFEEWSFHAEAAFANGTLSFQGPSSGENGVEVNWNLSILEDGTLSVALQRLGSPVTFYLTEG